MQLAIPLNTFQQSWCIPVITDHHYHSKNVLIGKIIEWFFLRYQWQGCAFFSLLVMKPDTKIQSLAWNRWEWHVPSDLGDTNSFENLALSPPKVCWEPGTTLPQQDLSRCHHRRGSRAGIPLKLHKRISPVAFHCFQKAQLKKVCLNYHYNSGSCSSSSHQRSCGACLITLQRKVQIKLSVLQLLDCRLLYNFSNAATEYLSHNFWQLNMQQ